MVIARRPGSTTVSTGLRERILDATGALLARTAYADVTVAHILEAAQVSRASFYFYFPSRAAVLAELVRRAVEAGHAAAQPWLTAAADPVATLRAGVTDGARLWRENAAVLVAVVDHASSDPALRDLWQAQMQTFTDAALARIEADPVARAHLTGQSLPAVAAALTWLGERLYYLAATGVAPFADESVLVDTLHAIWVSTLYGGLPPVRPA